MTPRRTAGVRVRNRAVRVVAMSRAAGAAVVLLMAPAPLRAQSYQFTKVVDNATPRPDGAGLFKVTGAAIDGSTVVFQNGAFCATCGFPDSIWATDPGGNYTKLADTTTPVPGGSGTFSNFDKANGRPQVRNGIVLFLAYDAASKPGLYTVPVAGGTIRVVANTSTMIPGTTFTFTGLSYLEAVTHNGVFGLDGSTVVFWGTGGTVQGLYAASIDGSNLRRLADTNTPAGITSTPCIFYINLFDTPSIYNGSIAFRGSGVLGLSGFNALYTRPLAPNECPDPSLINSNQGLPGSSYDHTAFIYALADLDRVVFAGFSSFSPPLFGGLYAIGANGPSIIADVTTPLPGLKDAPFFVGTTDNFVKFAVDQGRVLFYVQDSTNKNALFLATGGSITRVIGSGDVIDGKTVYAVDPPFAGDVSGQRFVCRLRFDQFAFDHAIYSAFTLIVSNPANQTIAYGGTANLSVVASGSGLSYQWYHGTIGVTTNPIGGATASSYAPSLISNTNYWVRVSSASGQADSATATVTVAFTDSPLTAGMTVIRAAHLNELRARINAVRAASGLGAFGYSNAISAGTVIRAVDITEMQTALSQAYVAASMSAPPFSTHPTVGETVVVADIADLRKNVQPLER